MKQYKAGKKAFIDSFGGLVPCRVVEVCKPGTGRFAGGVVEVRILAGGPMQWAYPVGSIDQFPATSVIPCNHLVKRGYKLRIDINYEWVK